VQLGRVQRIPRQVGQGRVDGSDALACAVGRVASPLVGEGEPCASMRVSPLRATMSKTARRRSSTSEQRRRQFRGRARGRPCGVTDGREGGGAACASVRDAAVSSEDQARPACRSSEVVDAGRSARSTIWGWIFRGLWICGRGRPPAAAGRPPLATSGEGGARGGWLLWRRRGRLEVASG
jgi:hypothetical protein